MLDNRNPYIEITLPTCGIRDPLTGEIYPETIEVSIAITSKETGACYGTVCTFEERKDGHSIGLRVPVQIPEFASMVHAMLEGWQQAKARKE